jgi:hypothetical protein
MPGLIYCRLARQEPDCTTTQIAPGDGIEALVVQPTERFHDATPRARPGSRNREEGEDLVDLFSDWDHFAPGGKAPDRTTKTFLAFALAAVRLDAIAGA